MTDFPVTSKLFDEYPIDMCHPLIVENPEWEEKITPSLIEIGTAYDNQEMTTEQLVIALRGMIEVAYTMGYYNKEK